jgi:hypothetical protein
LRSQSRNESTERRLATNSSTEPSRAPARSPYMYGAKVHVSRLSRERKPHPRNTHLTYSASSSPCLDRRLASPFWRWWCSAPRPLQSPVRILASRVFSSAILHVHNCCTRSVFPSALFVSGKCSHVLFTFVARTSRHHHEAPAPQPTAGPSISPSGPVAPAPSVSPPSGPTAPVPVVPAVMSAPAPYVPSPAPATPAPLSPTPVPGTCQCRCKKKNKIRPMFSHLGPHTQPNLDHIFFSHHCIFGMYFNGLCRAPVLQLQPHSLPRRLLLHLVSLII